MTTAELDALTHALYRALDDALDAPDSLDVAFVRDVLERCAAGGAEDSVAHWIALATVRTVGEHILAFHASDRAQRDTMKVRGVLPSQYRHTLVRAA